MHQDVLKLIDLAKEKGFVSLCQREMILRKARELGDDPVEVEFFLDDIPIKEETFNSSTSQWGNQYTSNDQTHLNYVQENTIFQKGHSQKASVIEEKTHVKKKKKKWIWVLLIMILVLVTTVFIVSLISNNLGYNNNSYFTSWDDKLTQFDNGMASCLSEMYTLEDDSKYQWLVDLYFELEYAEESGTLTAAQVNRFHQIKTKYENQLLYLGIGSLAVDFFNQFIN